MAIIPHPSGTIMHRSSAIELWCEFQSIYDQLAFLLPTIHIKAYVHLTREIRGI